MRFFVCVAALVVALSASSTANAQLPGQKMATCASMLAPLIRYQVHNNNLSSAKMMVDWAMHNCASERHDEAREHMETVWERAQLGVAPHKK